MHVALVIGHFPPAGYGGAELQAEGWAKRLARRHRVTVITRADAARPPGREGRDGYTVVRTAVSAVPVWRTFADLDAIRRAVGALEPRPDLLLCFQTFISGLAGTRAGRALGIPAVVWIRGEAEYRLGASRFLRWISPGIWRGAAGVLVQSETNRVELLRELERVSPASVPRVRERLAVVENGLTLPAPSPLPARGGVLAVGRLVADKGMDVAIAACARAGLPLTIAGEGPERSALEALAHRLGAGVHFVGYVKPAALAPLYAAARIVVLAARRGEGLPNVLLEALAHGRAVVATPCAGTRDLIEDGGNGVLVPPGDVEALAGALARLAANDGDAGALVQRLASAGRASVERFAWEAVEPRLEAVLVKWGRA
jgi:glycosyltransferase involved in cell wall biosynthesis